MTLALIDIPADADMGAALSPAFAARYPTLLNPEQIPESILDLMKGIWSIGRFAESPVRIARLRDVWIAAEGLVFDAEGRLYRETVTQHSADEIERAQASVRAAQESGGAAEAGGPVVLCKKRGTGNYGHWLMEMLPKAHLVSRMLPGLSPRILLANDAEPLRRNAVESLALLGIEADRLILLDDRAVMRVDEVIVVDGLTNHGCYMSPLVMNCIGQLREAVAPQRPSRLLVTRGASATRRFVNEDAVFAYAAERGYLVIDPGTLSQSQQIAIFSGATEIVGVSGAAMTNIAFAPSGTRVLNLVPAGMPDTFFWFIANLRGLDYAEFRCEGTGPVRGNSVWDTDLILPPERWEEVFTAE